MGVGVREVPTQVAGELTGQVAQVVPGGLGLTETAQGLEGFQGQEEFWFVVRVTVVAVRGVERDSAVFLGVEPLTGAFGVGVDLEGQGLLSGQILEKERQACTEPFGDLGPQDALRGVGDQARQGVRGTVGGPG